MACSQEVRALTYTALETVRIKDCLNDICYLKNYQRKINIFVLFAKPLFYGTLMKIINSAKLQERLVWQFLHCHFATSVNSLLSLKL